MFSVDQHDVFRLDVAVHNARRFEGVERSQHLRRHAADQGGPAALGVVGWVGVGEQVNNARAQYSEEPGT